MGSSAVTSRLLCCRLFRLVVMCVIFLILLLLFLFEQFYPPFSSLSSFSFSFFCSLVCLPLTPPPPPPLPFFLFLLAPPPITRESPLPSTLSPIDDPQRRHPFPHEALSTELLHPFSPFPVPCPPPCPPPSSSIRPPMLYLLFFHILSSQSSIDGKRIRRKFWFIP